MVRRTQPHAPRGFKTPFVPWVPAAGVLCCVSMMLFLPADTWIRLVMWMLIGLDIYSAYGVTHSVIGGGTKQRHGQTVLNIIGGFIGVLCVIKVTRTTLVYPNRIAKIMPRFNQG